MDFKALQKIADVHSVDRRRRSAVKESADDRWFADQYISLTRRIQPDFELSRKGFYYLCRARGSLVAADYFNRKSWKRYLDHCFKAFRKIVKGKIDCPPPANVAGEFLLNDFVRNKDNRKAYFAGVVEVLQAGGFKLGTAEDEVHPKPVKWLAEDVKNGKGKVETIEPEIYRRAVQYVLDHWDQVGWA